MAAKDVNPRWFLYGASIQLHQRTTLWYYTFSNSAIEFLPKTTNMPTSIVSFEAYLDPVELSVKPLLNAKHHIVHSLLRTNSIIRRIPEGVKGVCQLVRSISLFQTTVHSLDPTQISFLIHNVYNNYKHI
jgi:hypothetical protein